MIRPTPRAVYLFSAALPLAWLALSVRTTLWPWAFHPSILVLICIAADAVRARPRRQVEVEVDLPSAGYIGQDLDASVTVRSAEAASKESLEASLDVAGDVEAQLEA